MSRLFWKFFLAFWGCLLLAATVTLGLLDAFQPEPADVRLAEGPRAQFLLETAEVVLTHEGPEGLRALLDRVSRRMPKPPPVFAVNQAGEELKGRPLPDDLARAFAQGLSNDDPPQRGLAKATAPSGERWAVFILRPLRSQSDREVGAPAPRAHSNAPNYMLGMPSILALGVVALSSLLFAALLAYTFSRPFTRLKQGFRRVASGHLDTRLTANKPSRGEIGELLHGFDQMASELNKQIEQQKTLLHDVSHELRSPLARLNLAVGLARQSPNEVESSLNRIENEADRLEQLIGQLLTLSRLESTRHQPAMVKHDVIELLENVLDDAQFESEQLGRHLQCDLQVQSWNRLCLPDALHSAFENVIRNAIRHTPEGQTVFVGAHQDNAKLVIEVRDQGLGVSLDNPNQLFEPFFKSGNHAGHGLGLAIVHKAVNLHHGQVTAENAHPGLRVKIELSPFDTESA